MPDHSNDSESLDLLLRQIQEIKAKRDQQDNAAPKPEALDEPVQVRRKEAPPPENIKPPVAREPSPAVVSEEPAKPETALEAEPAFVPELFKKAADPKEDGLWLAEDEEADDADDAEEPDDEKPPAKIGVRILAGLIAMAMMLLVFYLAVRMAGERTSKSLLTEGLFGAAVENSENMAYGGTLADEISETAPPPGLFPSTPEDAASSFGQSAVEYVSDTASSSSLLSSALAESGVTSLAERSSKPASSSAAAVSAVSKKPASSAVVSKVSSSSSSSKLSSVAPITSKITSAAASSSPAVVKDEVLVIYQGKKQTMDAEKAVSIWLVSEIGNSWPMEVTKAQAIAAYTYLKRYTEADSYVSIGSKAAPGSTTTIGKAIAAVSGKAAYYGSDYAFTPWFSSSIGKTMPSEQVWGGKLNYLRSVDSSIEIGYTGFGWKSTETLTQAEVKKDLEEYYDCTLSSDPSKWIVVKSYLQTVSYENKTIGYVDRCTIDGRISTSGHALRNQVIGLRSVAFEVAYNASAKTFSFTTYGYGHGCGMSQVGAMLYAKQGWSYEKILKHYYTGITIK